MYTTMNRFSAKEDKLILKTMDDKSITGTRMSKFKLLSIILYRELGSKRTAQSISTRFTRLNNRRGGNKLQEQEKPKIYLIIDFLDGLDDDEICFVRSYLDLRNKK